MKKKLLTVLLAVVMVFGVFGLTACGNGANPDDSYNYYSSKYEVEGDVRIEAATYQTVYRMFTTAGKFLLYIDSESGNDAAARFKAINELANEWDVTIYHFNPDLSGGFASDDTSRHTTNILATLDEVAAASQLKTVQDNLFDISNDAGLGDEDSNIKDNSLLAVSGAAPSIVTDDDLEDDPTLVVGELKYNGAISASNTVADGAKSIAAIATRRPSYAQYKEGDNTAVPAAYNTSNINTMNLFADNRLHMYNDDGTDAFTDEKTDVYVTVANYAQFAWLLDNNDGYFAVFFGGTWCGNTQAIAMLTNDLAKDYGIGKVYMFDPRLDNGVRAIWQVAEQENEDGEVEKVASKSNSSYLASNLNTRSADATGARYNFNYLYARFLNEYLPTYESEWNYGMKLSITSNGETDSYTRMCVPNIMMFNGEGADENAELIALAEAEYSYSNTSVEGTAENVEWTNAVKAVFDQNPYALYNPIIEAPAADDTTTSGGATSGGSASSGAAAGGGESAC